MKQITFIDNRIPFWFACILKKHGKDAIYFYKLFPGYKTFYSEDGKAMWIGGFQPFQNYYPAITWRIFFFWLFRKNKK